MFLDPQSNTIIKEWNNGRLSLTVSLAIQAFAILLTPDMPYSCSDNHSDL